MLLFDKITQAVKSAIGDTVESDVRVWKDSGGTHRILMRYSNKFRDDDYPVKEIISSESHKKFVKLVEEGLAPLPEYWVWHNENWKFGEAEWVAYDDSGFALTGGVVYPEFADLAEQLASVKDMRVSHGMPGWSIVRDESDPTVITQHISTEISVLPGWAAANKLTDSAVMLQSKESDEMAISDAKKRELVEDWGIKAETLNRLEELNAVDAAKASAAGIESKEVDVTEDLPVSEEAQEQPVEEQKQEGDATEVAEEAKADDVKEVAEPNQQNEELVKAVGSTMNAVIALSEQVKELAAQLNELKGRDEEKVTAKAASTPLASLQALMQKSVIGEAEALVDGRTALAKDGPVETPADDPTNYTPFQFVNQQIARSRQNNRGVS